MLYEMSDGVTSYEDEKQNMIQIANFEAKIIEELRYIDGKKQTRYYVIEGKKEKEKLDPVIVESEDFANMKWISNSWGSQAIIFPKGNAKEMMRSIIQLVSNPKVTDIFTHTGWIKKNGKDVYITNGSGISAEKKVDTIKIEVPTDLNCYSLPIKEGNVKEALKASIGLRNIMPKETAWMLLGSIYRAPIGEADYAVHITGRTGTFKSEIAALVQSHFGECSARKLPASWSSTANALEALAYKAKDAVLVIDDFIPTGTSWQVKSYQKTADQIIRGQGNQSGRARLNDRSSLQETMYPRGIIVSTGEDTPEGHSVRARIMISEFSPGDIKTENLTKAQNKKHLYQFAMSAYVQWLAADLKGWQKTAKEMAKKIRDENLGIGHSRTPPTLGQILSGVWMFLEFSRKFGMKVETQQILYKEAVDSLRSLANRQVEYLIAADPADQFISILRSIFAANSGHARGMHGGIPRKAQLLGWTTIGDPEDNEFKPHGPRLGWVEEKTKTLYLDAAIAYDTIRRHSRGSITITRQTLYKRLREAGHLAKHDQARQRNTVRVQCEQAGRTCLALKLNAITEGEENG